MPRSFGSCFSMGLLGVESDLAIKFDLAMAEVEWERKGRRNWVIYTGRGDELVSHASRSPFPRSFSHIARNLEIARSAKTVKILGSRHGRTHQKPPTEASLIKSSASADQSTAVEIKDSLVLFFSRSFFGT